MSALHTHLNIIIGIRMKPLGEGVGRGERPLYLDISPSRLPQLGWNIFNKITIINYKKIVRILNNTFMVDFLIVINFCI